MQINIGNETASGSWKHAYESQFTYSIDGRTFLYGEDMSAKRWFIQELLPGGEMGEETATGHWRHPYAVQFPFQMRGRQFFYGQDLYTGNWFIQELLPGGKMGDETDSGHWNNPYAVQFPFQVGGRQFFYGQNQDTRYWFIQELLPGGRMGEETDRGFWNNPYAVQVPFEVGGRQFFYGQNKHNKHWFIQELLPGGKMGEETHNGSWNHFYAAQFVYPQLVYNNLFFYGQDMSSKRWFVQLLLPGGTMGVEVATGHWNKPYAVQVPYSVGGSPYWYGQNMDNNHWFIQELVSAEQYKICEYRYSSDDPPPTYAVGWIPYLADWARYIKNYWTGRSIFRYHDPSEIPGVGVLIGVRDGKLYGDSLKDRMTVEVRPMPKSEGHYSWVLVPGGKILYVWNSQLQLDSRNYTRHSDLNRGEPVTCAGEFYITRAAGLLSLNEVHIELNDSSGHYKPSGARCFKYVLDEFRKLGIDTSGVEMYSRTE